MGFSAKPRAIKRPELPPKQAGAVTQGGPQTLRIPTENRGAFLIENVQGKPLSIGKCRETAGRYPCVMIAAGE